MIQFDKDLSQSKHLWVFNNNIITFHDDGDGIPSYCDIVSDEFTSRIYPDPNGKFVFDFKSHLKALAIVNNLQDSIELNVGNSVPELVKDDTENTKFDLSITISVNFEDAEPVSVNKNYSFLAGVEQLKDYQQQLSPQRNLFLLQSPLNKTEYFVNYWEGYPFDLSIYALTAGNLNIENNRTAMQLDVPITGNVSRITFSDSNSNITIHDYLPLATGWNTLFVRRPGYDSEVHLDESPIRIILNKIESKCGTYVKFRNPFGGWSYWLFHQERNSSITVSKHDELENDFENIEDTIAPTIHSGADDSREVLECTATKVTSLDLLVLAQIVESPKVYLFTGERYSVNKTAQPNQWIEVECLTRSIDKQRVGRNKYDVQINLGLPERKTVSLL